MCLKELCPCFWPDIDMVDDNLPTPSKLKPTDNGYTSQTRPKANGSLEKSNTNSQQMLPNNGDHPSKVKHMKPKAGVDTISQLTDPNNGDQTLLPADDGARISYEKFTTKDQTETRNNYGAAADAEGEIQKKPQNKSTSSQVASWPMVGD